MKSSDAILHTVHMDGAAIYNLPFPFTNQIVSFESHETITANPRKPERDHNWMFHGRRAKPLSKREWPQL